MMDQPSIQALPVFLFSLSGKKERRRCGECDKKTKEGKPFCEEHLEHMPYVSEVLEKVRQIDEVRAFIISAACDPQKLSQVPLNCNPMMEVRKELRYSEDEWVSISRISQLMQICDQKIDIAKEVAELMAKGGFWALKKKRKVVFALSLERVF